MDNGRDFRGKMLKKAALIYKFNLYFRPVRTPNWGGHIERLCGTLNAKIHDLPGTTGSSPQLKNEYNMLKQASMTISDMEKWLLIFILKIYHLRDHSAINMSPLQKYNEGILGNENCMGIGLPRKYNDERKVKLNFMPFVERTIQKSGVQIDHMFYYDEILRQYINSEEDGYLPKKKKFIFRRDPRDISKIYFFDPNLKDYFEIPYKDLTHPPMSIWVYKEILSNLKKNKIKIDENVIFKAYDQLTDIEKMAELRKKELNKKSRESDSRNFKVGDDLEVIRSKDDSIDKTFFDDIDYSHIKPFNDIDYGAL